MNCQKCNFQNEEAAKFCRNCGTELVIEQNLNLPKKKRKMSVWILSIFVALIIAIAGVVAWYYYAEAEKEKKKEAAENYYNKGKEAYVDGLYDLAISYYTKVIEIDSNYVKAYIGLLETNTIQGNNETALKYANKALAINPNEIEAYRYMGIIYGIQKDYVQAINYLEKAIQFYKVEDNSNNQKLFSSTYYSLGLVYVDMGNLQKGTENMQIAARKGFDAAKVWLKNRGYNW